jgi:polysaccharide export outer membrane protein
MTIADLIPNTDALLQPDYFKKKSALVGFDWNHADRAIQDERLLQEMSPEEQEAYFKRYVQRQQSRENQRLLHASPGQQTGQEQKQSNGSGQFGSNNLMGQTQDQQANKRWESNQILSFAQQQETKNRLDTVEDNIKNLLPQINWDYAVIERLDRNTLQAVLLPFNLRKAMARDSQHNLALQPGDVVTVFSGNDGDIPKTRKTALIKVTGEVGSPGFYQVKAGETLRDVLVRAGGLAPNAFLYGTKLTRRSLLRQQEELYNKALDQAERLLQVAMSRASASAVNPADAGRVQTQADSQQRYLAKLRSTRPDGRVVLNVSPKATGMGQLPPLALEDGDVVQVPSVPGQVAVFGAVYTQGAFSYEEGRHVWDYLGMAGGAARGSDKGSIFVLRANGSVESAQQGWLPVVNGLRGVRALPGDTVYVPEDFDRVSFMKGLLDVSQVFYQVGLGAAAINAIRD